MDTRSKVYIIAELSANHNNDINLAKKTIKAIAETGADAVKVQTYTADSLSLDVDNEYFKRKEEGLWRGYRPYDLYKEASLPYNWHRELQEVALNEGLDFFSTPFDKEGVDFLELLNVPKYKIASFEVTDIPLIEYVASKKKPIIISTGVAEVEDIEQALDACYRENNRDVTLLKCTSEYPATIGQANLATITDMKARFDCKVGLSDHTIGSLVPIAAVSLGAEVVEKHIILDRSLGGPDSAFSMNPTEFKIMVENIRNVEQALGNVTYDVSEKNKLRRRSLFVSKKIEKSQIITEENIRSVRPGHGLHPKYKAEVIGKSVIESLEKGTPLLSEKINDFKA